MQFLGKDGKIYATEKECLEAEKAFDEKVEREKANEEALQKELQEKEEALKEACANLREAKDKAAKIRMDAETAATEVLAKAHAALDRVKRDLVDIQTALRKNDSCSTNSQDISSSPLLPFILPFLF